ncbi:unnamed protein product [Nyctereutes procyonoides]|uniref:(raccoon dog) hypothetical protein n=1 Tax=Nyctereutes procyonoides TaxID=34880 RepID=A0A811YGC2_NYCPR|nr:unnamed protein product [Nyctereutes procyonoides]
MRGGGGGAGRAGGVSGQGGDTCRPAAQPSIPERGRSSRDSAESARCLSPPAARSFSAPWRAESRPEPHFGRAPRALHARPLAHLDLRGGGSPPRPPDRCPLPGDHSATGTRSCLHVLGKGAGGGAHLAPAPVFRPYPARSRGLGCIYLALLSPRCTLASPRSSRASACAWNRGGAPGTLNPAGPLPPRSAAGISEPLWGRRGDWVEPREREGPRLGRGSLGSPLSQSPGYWVSRVPDVPGCSSCSPQPHAVVLGALLMPPSRAPRFLPGRTAYG